MPPARPVSPPSPRLVAMDIALSLFLSSGQAETPAPHHNPSNPRAALVGQAFSPALTSGRSEFPAYASDAPPPRHAIALFEILRVADVLDLAVQAHAAAIGDRERVVRHRIHLPRSVEHERAARKDRRTGTRDPDVADQLQPSSDALCC